MPRSPDADALTRLASVNMVNPPAIAAVRHHVVASRRPSTIPAQKNASHGSSGWVPLTNTSRTSPWGDSRSGEVSHDVVWPSRARSYTHQWMDQPASAATTPITTSQRIRSVNIHAARKNIAP